MTIELGDKVKCKYSGYTGIVTAISNYINGCTQMIVAGKWDGKSEEPPTASIDEESLIIIKKGKEEEAEKSGGKNKKGIKCRGF